jgi:PAT family beta-lactamase induction signal transducer AmpG
MIVAGFTADAAGWPAFFALCAAAAIPDLVMLAWLQWRGHFAALAEKPDDAET